LRKASDVIVVSPEVRFSKDPQMRQRAPLLNRAGMEGRPAGPVVKRRDERRLIGDERRGVIL
jgi:hypothetical protein